MIPFIFLMSIISFMLLIFSIVKQIQILGLISSMAIMIIGVTTLASGMEGINDLITLTLGTIFVCFGSYIFINGSLEEIEAY